MNPAVVSAIKAGERDTKKLAIIGQCRREAIYRYFRSMRLKPDYTHRGERKRKHRIGCQRKKNCGCTPIVTPAT